MSDVVSRLSEREIADLCALADGTLPAERRAAVEERVAASPELQELVDRHRRTVMQTRSLASDPVPESLRATVGKQRRVRDGRRSPLSRPMPRLGLAGALAAAVAVIVLVLSGGSAAPTVADAAGVTTRPPNAPAPRPVAGRGTELSANVEGVAFPNLRPPYGWRAVGLRRDKLDGRNTTTVFYAKGRRRIAYVIVGGRALDRPSDARSVTREGVLFQTLRLEGRPAVTWRRAGHSCVLVGPAPRAELVALASY
jgi:anti-sigma factor RsiW